MTQDAATALSSRPVLLLVKAGEFKHTGGYALYGNPPRWHKIHPHKPAPKAAPVAHDPQSIGSSSFSMPPEQVALLKLDASNTNAGTFNKQVDKLVALAAAGDAAAILGASFGVNTYGAKAAKIANWLLEQMGVAHQVSAGQKAGTNAAVQAPADAAPTAADEPKTTDGLQELGAAAPLAQHVKDTLDEKAADGDVEFLQNVAKNNPEHPQIVAYAKQKLAELQAKAPTPATHHAAEKSEDAQAPAEDAGPSLPPGAKLSTDVNAVPLMHTTTPEAAAAIQKDGFNLSGNSMYGKGVYFSSVAQSAAYGSTVLGAKLKPHKQLVLTKDSDVSKAFMALTGLSSGHLGSDKGAQAMIDAGVGSMVFPVDDETYTVVFDPGLIDVLADAADTGPKEGDTKPGADGGTLVLKDGHWVKQGGDEPSAPAVKPEHFEINTGDVFNLDSQYEKMNAGDWVVYNVSQDGQLVYMHKVGAKVPNQKNSATIPAMTLQEAITKGTAKKVSDHESSAVYPAASAPTQPAQGAVSVVPPTGDGLDGLNLPASVKDYLLKPSVTLKNGKTVTPKEYIDDLLSDGYGNPEYFAAPKGSKAGFLTKPGKPKLTLNDKQMFYADAAFMAQKKAAKAAQSHAASTTTGHTKLDQIPWDTLNLPDTNTNAKSHNAAVAKIKAMAYAGDKAGLQAFIDKKAGAKQNYAKKQHLLAQTALAGITEDGAPAPAAAPAASMEGKPAYDTVAIAVKKGAKPIDAAEQWLAANPGGHVELSEALISLGHSDVAADMDLPAPGMEEDAPEPAPAAAAVTADTPLHSKQLAALESLSLDELKAIDNSPGLPENVQAWIDNKIHEMESASDKGPNEGDMKPGADGMLVFKDGRWHKVKEDSAEDQQHPLDSVPLPDVSTAPGMSWKEHIGTSLSTLKEKAKQDPSVLKGVAKKMANGKYIFHLPHYKPGYENSHKVKFHGFSDASKNVYDYIEALKVATGQSPKNASKKANATPAPAASQAAPIAPVAPSGIEPMDTWVQTGGQGGSNPGGKFKDPRGQEWYCKFPDDADTAKSEVLAAKLYALAGLSGQDCKLITKDGKVGIASKWVNIKKASSAAALAKVPGALDGFAVDAWLGNWDVVGQALDNLQIDPDGKAHRVDAGGSLEYRAQGEKKPFGTNVEEIDTLRNAAKNSHAAAVFGNLKEADITASVAKVAAISDVAIRAMVNEYGPGTAAEKLKLAETLIARKQDLIKKYPKAAKAKKKPVFKPEKISAPPSFLNWGGSGKSGPSSKEFLNKANEDSVQAIFAAAKTGNLDAIKNLTAKVYDKETGAVIGEKPVLEHPSQHVKGYAQQAVNEINYQMNPPKRFRFDGGHPLHALNSAYPAHTGGPSSATAQKLGKFIVLGEPGALKLEDVGLPAKITHSEGGGTLSRQTYKEQAHAVWHKMPATQSQAIKSYTGSAFKEMNGSLWDGNPTGAAKAAAEALQTLGHDIQPGTVLSRHIDTSKFSPGEVEHLLKSTGKVLQEPAIMSTSIRPSSWVRSIQFKLHVGPGVKGLWVGPGSEPGGGAISINGSEDEMLLPPNTRILILSVKPASKDADGFGAHGQQHVIEAIILPTK